MNAEAPPAYGVPVTNSVSETVSAAEELCNDNAPSNTMIDQLTATALSAAKHDSQSNAAESCSLISSVPAL